MLRLPLLAGLIAGFLGIVGPSSAQDLNGQFEIYVKVGKDRTLYLHPGDKLLSLRRSSSPRGQVGNRFYFKPLGNGLYDIRAEGATGPRLHEDGNGDKLISTRYKVDDDFTRFYLEKQKDGSYRIKTKATGRYWHVDGNGDRLASTRYQPNDDFQKFQIIKYSAPVSLFDTTYTTLGTMAWATQKSTNTPKHEVTFTNTYARPIALSMKVVGTAESEKFGTMVRLLGKDRAPALRDFRLMLEDQKAQADKKSQARVVMGHVGHISIRNGQTILLLQDLSQFQNEAYTRTNHFVGPFLESIKVTYGAAPGWGLPSISPLSQNKNGSYSQSTTIGADITAGFQGKTPAGSLGANFSQTTTSGTEVPDIVFHQTTYNSQPIFTWKLGNVYPASNEVEAYKDDPWNMVRKYAGQVAIDRSVHEAAALAKGTFEIATHCAYTIPRTTRLPEFKVRLDYEVTYRAVFSDPQNFKNSAEAFGRGFAFIFGLDPNMYSGQTFRSWGTVKIVHKFPLEVTIPAAVINQ